MLHALVRFETQQPFLAKDHARGQFLGPVLRVPVLVLLIPE